MFQCSVLGSLLELAHAVECGAGLEPFELALVERLQKLDLVLRAVRVLQHTAHRFTHSESCYSQHLIYFKQLLVT